MSGTLLLCHKSKYSTTHWYIIAPPFSHDVGKSKIDHALINKSGKLSDEEFEQMKFHATAGGEILTGMKCYTHNVVRMAAEHHEKFKGGGYPSGIQGEEIHRYARICKIMDVYDALTTKRSYKKALSAFVKLIIMKKNEH